MTTVRAWLGLGRVANLPTIWSNCLAGWWLGGGGNSDELPFLFAGATLLYFGGVLLNDAFDADFDREHRKGRPIAAGIVSLGTVWRWGLICLVLGVLSLLWLGTGTGGLGLTLMVTIVLYNTVHKAIRFAPVLMGVCRFLVYLAGASTGYRGVTGGAIWCGLALATYLTGLRFLASAEAKAPPPRWPIVLLGVPVALAILMDAGIYREHGLLLSAILVLWLLRCLRRTFWSPERNLSDTVSGLTAGIVWVDWLAVAYAPRELAGIFIGLFLTTLLFQRLAPTEPPRQ